MTERKNPRKLMIWDIESYIHRACTCCKELAEVVPFVYQELYKLENGIDYLKKTCNELMTITKADDVVVVLGDPEGNFRKELNPDYKAQRGSKPLMYDLIRDYVIQTFDCVILPKLEADDCARIIYEDKIEYDNKDKVIVSIDKDFYSFPCKFYRDIPSERKEVIVDKVLAEYNLMLQTIMGDTADNYSGIPGWGRAKTKRWLAETQRKWSDVLALFKENGLTAQDYTMNKIMAKMIGYKNYDLDKKEIVNYD